ncbi:MAG: acyl-CoA thioesterase [Alphaproteobacteria bacterium]|nr:acyl-CoA thioesterase [Alphaproteobacteria bacterium]
MTLDLADRRIYGFATDEHLRFADVDANGHVNNGAFLQLLENARVSYMRAIVHSGLPRFRVVVGRLEVDFKRQMFYPGRATACARLIEVQARKCVIGHALFDGEEQCTAVLKAIMVSLDERTHRSTPFDPAVRTALEKYAASPQGVTPNGAVPAGGAK